MKFSLSALSASLLLLAGAGPGVSASPLHSSNETCISPRPIPDFKGSDFRNFGVVMFRGLDMIDVFGTLDPLQLMSLSTQQMRLHLIAETLEPITTEPGRMNPHNSTFFPIFPVTDTFESAEELDLDVLIIPGGGGVRNPTLQAEEEFIRKMYPRVKLMLTVCTGAGLAARAGVLDGRMATTNKAAWATMTEWGPKVQWVSPARYVMDGNIWSSSGVTSALDLVFAFIETYWGTEEKNRVAGIIEHEPREWDDDPFSDIHDIPPTEAKPCPAE